MSNYTIAAIPTLYRGRKYRSRLEARWAAFFDTLGWRHEYEPFDLGKWSPDFVLPDWGVLVEVKPWESLDIAAWEKAVRACEDRGMLDDSDERDAIGGIFMTRLAPARDGTIARLGWFGSGRNGFEPDVASMGWHLQHHKPEVLPSITVIDAAGWHSADGDASPWLNHQGHLCGHPPAPFAEHTMGLWAKATGAVQWIATEDDQP